MENESRRISTKGQYDKFIFSLAAKHAFFKQIAKWARNLSDEEWADLVNRRDNLANERFDKASKITKRKKS